MSDKLITYDERKLRASIDLTLLSISKTIGVKESPTVAELEELTTFIVTYFKDYADDIPTMKIAFDYAVANGVENYGKMDKTFIARALNVYKPVLRIKNSKIIGTTHQLAYEAPNNESCYFSLLDYIHKHKDFPMAWDWLKVFAYMDSEEVNMFRDEYNAEGEMHDDIKMKWHRELQKQVAEEKANIQNNSNKSVDPIVIKQMLDNVTEQSVLNRALKQKIKERIYDEQKSDLKAGIQHEAKNAK